jgi:cytochrome P450
MSFREATSSAYAAPMTERIVGHAAVRAALRDTETYSSDIQGDADVRDYRQIPLEVDPPRHHQYRSALNPLFVRPRIESLVPRFTKIGDEILREFESNGGGNFIEKVALPYVVRCLTVIYNRPQDFDEWMSWGADVWIATPTGRTGEFLHAYLDRAFLDTTTDEEDAWSYLRALRIDDQPMSRDEFVGAGSVMLAGGRDTVVKLITFSTWHLLSNPDDVRVIESGEVSLASAITEFLRFLSPLPGMLRLAPHAKEKPDADRTEEDFLYVSFASANHDDSIFENADKVDIHRQKVAHVAFGFGPHTCIGNHVAELETRTLIEQIVPKLKNWTLHKGDIAWEPIGNSQFPGHFRELSITCN